MIRAVLFDLDGTLVETREAWWSLTSAAARDLGAPPLSRLDFERNFGASVESDAQSFFPGRTAAELAAYYVAHFHEHAKKLTVDPEAPLVLTALAGRGIKTAVITNTPGPLAREVVAGAGLVADTVVGDGDVPRPKPAPDMVLAALDRLGVKAGEAIVVGDSRFDREAARAAGVRFAGLKIAGDVMLRRLGEVLDIVEADGPHS